MLKKEKNNIYYFLILLIIIIIVLIILNILKLFYLKEKQYFTYPMTINDVLKKKTIIKLLLKNNISQNNNKWTIYVPLSYNNIEKELPKIIINKYSKIVFGINGSDSLISKNRLYINLKKYYSNSELKNMIPNTYLTNSQTDMNYFNKIYDNNKLYILKKNIQQKKGILLTNNLNIIKKSLQENYVIIQEFIKDSVLIKGRKMNLRLYLIIIIKNNKIKFYVHDYKKCLYTNNLYNNNDLNKDENITSSELDIDIYNDYPLTFKELCSYLIKNNYDVTLLNKNLNSLLKKRVLFIKIYYINLRI